MKLRRIVFLFILILTIIPACGTDNPENRIKCLSGAVDIQRCGIDNLGIEQRTCIDTYWSGWSSCEIPECESGKHEVGTCGLDETGTQERSCRDWQWDEWSRCIPLLEQWGFGTVLERERSNSRQYTFYVDQRETGIHWGSNCGPATVTMGAKWSSEEFNQTAIDARGTYLPNGDWWSTKNIRDYLDLYEIPFVQIPKEIIVDAVDLYDDDETFLLREIDGGNSAILCIDMDDQSVNKHFTYNPEPKERVDKFYSNGDGSGHFILVTGYKIVDEITFLEVHDPNSARKVYLDGELKGSYRYYRFSEVASAMDEWWAHAIIIEPKRGGKKSHIDFIRTVSDPETTPEAWGAIGY